MPTIDASPTKEFFISILTKDISLFDAIKELVDNCVDGARSLRGDGPYEGLWAHIEVKPDSFVIVDNCGGIGVETATTYAFRFGRKKGAPTLDRSIGQFGVGMKRALFKMGKRFEVSSIALDSRFKLVVDVDEWTKVLDENGHEKWELEFTEVAENEANDESSRGTTLEVTELYQSVASEFGSDVFVQSLIERLEESHSQSLDNGLEIKVNNFELRHQAATLLVGDSIAPIKIEKNLSVDVDDQQRTVKLTIYAGLSESSLKDAGWYIICNGRQILGADKTPLTGWDYKLDSNSRTPAAHGQFSRFRGYAVFESDNAKALPWNTSKSGVDAESAVYQVAKMEMFNALRQVVDFLNELDTERDTESTFLKDRVEAATPAKLSALRPSSRFVTPKRPISREKPKTVRVQYNQDIEDVDFAKEYFNVNSASKAGESTFQYFLQREREE